MSGVRLVQGQPSGNYQELILTNSTALDFMDFVTIDGDGFLKQAAAGEKIQGVFCEDSVTAASDNETVDQVKGKYAPISEDMVFELTSDQDCTQTDVGAYADIAVSGGAITANLPAGTSGQLEIIDFDPEREADNDKIRVKVSERQSDAYAQA